MLNEAQKVSGDRSASVQVRRLKVVPCFTQEVHKMRKAIATTSLLATLLASLPVASFADVPGRFGVWDNTPVHWNPVHHRFDPRFRGRDWYRNQRHWDNRFRRGGYWNNRYWNDRRWNGRHWNRRHWNRWYGRPYGFRGGYWGPGWNGYGTGALIGSALTFGLIDDSQSRSIHEFDTWTRRSIEACYRVERRNGREVRIELPRTACF